MTIIEPTAWKRFHQLRGGDKEASRQRALQLFPSAHAHALLARRKDHGRAEAALIGYVGIYHLMLAKPQPDLAPTPAQDTAEGAAP